MWVFEARESPGYLLSKKPALQINLQIKSNSTEIIMAFMWLWESFEFFSESLNKSSMILSWRLLPAYLSNTQIAKVLWRSGLGNYNLFKRFAVQTLLMSPEFALRRKFQTKHHWSLKLGSKLKYLNKNSIQNIQG